MARKTEQVPNESKTIRNESPRISGKKRTLFIFLAVVACLVLLEGLCGIGWLIIDYVVFRENLMVAEDTPEDFHCQHDSEIGWVHIPGKRVQDIYGAGRSISINKDGFRAKEGYFDEKPAGRFRVICLGDSFTLGYGVDDEDTFPAQLEAANPVVQAVNMGQGGYSVGQCYLWYRRDGAKLDADCLVFAIILDDFWRGFGGLTIAGYGLPVFQLSNGELVVTNQPVPEKIATGDRLIGPGKMADFFARHNSIFRTASAVVGRDEYRPTQPSGDERLQIATAIVDATHREAKQHSLPFVMLLIPELHELANPKQHRMYQDVSQLLRKHAMSRKIPYLDLYPHFVKNGPRVAESYYLDEKWHHLSEAGNRLVAEQLDKFLAANVSGYPQSGQRGIHSGGPSGGRSGGVEE